LAKEIEVLQEKLATVPLGLL